ncbi:hypothetical protein TEA_004563 [Camellia sinensis var. sinensis]|uniref:Uncharacterized protein n=1 Tax=Camellia sinensis var. sinensis TaxID=542762 RepID=A0A4S4DHE7_CAMSN|nr:hypothetical protein TEA_004563 [Camellia sinensis var. sinensis]
MMRSRIQTPRRRRRSWITDKSSSHPTHTHNNHPIPSHPIPSPSLPKNPDVVRGLNSCLVRLEPDNGRRISASLQISDFGSAKADFGTDLAISTRSELNPDLSLFLLCCVWLGDLKRDLEKEIEKEILYNEMEQADAYENDFIEYEDGNAAEARKGSLEMVTLADVEPLDVNPPNNAGTVSDDEADLNFLDDDLSE